MRTIVAACLAAFLGLMAVGGLGGCATARFDAATAISDDHVCQCVPVCRIIGRTAGGTGIPLGNNLILTARHVIKDRFLEVNGRRTRYSVVAKGEGVNDDWIVIRCRAAPAESTIELQPGYRPKPGEPVFFLGYWQGKREQPVEYREARRIPLCVVRAKVASKPMSFNLPTDGLLFAAAPLEGTSYHGVSGGPVAVYDEASGKLKVVGVYKGSWELTVFGTARTLHTAALLPENILDQALQDQPAAPTGN